MLDVLGCHVCVAFAVPRCAGVSILAFSQGPKQTWKAALPSSVALVEQEGAGSGKGPGLGSAVGGACHA